MNFIKNMTFFSLLSLFFFSEIEKKENVFIDTYLKRIPSSSDLLCSDLIHHFFKKPLSIPSVEKLQQFFQDLAIYDLTPWENLAKIERGYITQSNNISFIHYGSHTFDDERFLKSVYVGADLLERRKLHDSTSKILTELGYREQMGHLMPPRNIAKLYHAIYEKLVIAAKKEGIPIEEVTFPALRFSRGTAYQFVRPGIDPIPERAEGWELLTRSVELPSDQWARMVQEKKMLLGTEMFFHDIGHVLDYIERPHYMKAYREYLQIKTTALKDLNDTTKIRNAAKEFGPLVFRGDIERYLNEFLYLPNEKNIEEIKKIIPHLDLVYPSSRESLREYYGQTQSLKLAKQWIKKRFFLFSSHGGGARDWTVNRYLTPKVMNTGFTELLNDESSFFKEYSSIKLDQLEVKMDQHRDRLYSIYESPDLFLRLQYLVDLKEGKEIPKEITKHLEQLAHQQGLEINKFIDQLIQFHLAEVEYRIQSSLIFKISPEQIAKDTSLLYKKEEGRKEYSESRTFKFYSTYPKYSVQWFLAVDIARKIH